MIRKQRAVLPPRKALFGAFFVIILLGAGLLTSVSGAILTVTNSNDSGAGSLRQAILDANNNPGLDTIVFDIPGTNVHTITLAASSPLPAITEPVVIDGTTQTGFVGNNKPVIEINGTAAGNQAGLRLLAGGTTVRGLAINRCGKDGIDVSGAGTNVIQGNFLGTDPGGTISRGNAFEGIYVLGSDGNIIGGTNAGDRNVISANADAGVYLQGANGNLVLGNYIGTTLAGSARLANGNHGVIVSGGTGNVIGGTVPAARNLISGNSGSGIFLSGASSTGTLIQGNYVGTDVTGSLAISNGGYGVSVVGAVANTVGGASAGAGNLISGNGLAGVDLHGAGTANNAVAGNYIGTDAAGKLALGNGFGGVSMLGATGTIVGGTAAGARNVIAGNKQDGVFITTNSSGNVVLGNYIGTDAGGTNAVPNGFNGVSISSANSNTVGGTLAGARNLISGNAIYGVEIYFGATGNAVQGNYIGTTATGGTGLRNNFAGIGISGASANTIGGVFTSAGNVISANGDAGIYLSGGAAGNQIQANLIGTDATGMSPLGNAFEGIYIESAPANVIGGALPGAGNVVSANKTRGIFLVNAPGNVIQGNSIGTKSDGVGALGNTFHSVECEAGANTTTIGGAGSSGNRIAFTQTIYAGVRIRTGSTGNLIRGNAIFANGALGIDLDAVGPTLNDNCDADTGANMQQNFPVLTQAVSGTGTGVRGTLNSKANTTFLLQFFANPACDTLGYGEGQIYLGETSIVTSNDCNTSFVATVAGQAPPGFAVTATATDPANNTSEFSACMTAAAWPTLAATAFTNQQVRLAWTNNPAGFALKQTGSLNPPIQWSPVTNNPVSANGQFVVTQTLTSSNRFYLLSFE
jgi:titin